MLFFMDVILIKHIYFSAYFKMCSYLESCHFEFAITIEMLVLAALV